MPKRPLASTNLSLVSSLLGEWNFDRNQGIPESVHIGSPSKMWWKCAFGHEWQASVRDRARKKTGCPFCVGKRATSTNCVSSTPEASLWHPTKNLPLIPGGVTRSSNRKLWWLCENGHEWQAPPNHVTRLGSRCPQCRDQRDSRREQECRLELERLTGHLFPKSRPAWLVSSKGRQMELDGYCKDLGLAFEHHGVQHFHYTQFFQSPRKFVRTQELDVEKRNICRQQSVDLIEIRWDCKDISAFVKECLGV